MPHRVRIGHAHLKVRDLERSIEFYRRFLGLEVTERTGPFVFLTGGAVHHELALQAVGPRAPSPPAAGVGLYHVAFEVSDRRAFAEAFHALAAAGVPLAAVDHGISWALYFADPDGNGLEIYLDVRGTPEGTRQWNGRTLPLDAQRICEGFEGFEG